MTRLMGMILLAISVEMIFAGVKERAFEVPANFSSDLDSDSGLRGETDLEKGVTFSYQLALSTAPIHGTVRWWQSRRRGKYGEDEPEDTEAYVEQDEGSDPNRPPS